ncbi:MAG: flavodoxin family protein [Firmicutes bacterium]|nr:flavodoxin family protein [Bacillota bacterium]
MSKKVLILSGSPRKGGNSDLLCDEFLRGAKDAGNDAEKIFIRGKKVAPCNACYYCRDTGSGQCAVKDDMAEILDKMQQADVIVMASPVYFYSIDAQMKAVIDRSVARWTNIPNKEFYYIMTAAEESDTVMECTLACFRGFAACLENAQEKGVIYGKGVYEAGEIKGKTAMKEAYEMGRQV